MKIDDDGNGICDGCAQTFCVIELKTYDSGWVVVGDQHLCGNCVREHIDALAKRLAEAEADLHEARAWTLGPAINHHSRDAILSAARHLRSLFDANKGECNLHVAARLVEEFAFKVHPKQAVALEEESDE